MYEPSRHVNTCGIAGFQHWDGALALHQLKAGAALALVPEPDNPFDSEAVALYHDNMKLGYIPAAENSIPFLTAFFGHDVFEARILQIDPEAAPWNQVRVGLYVKDAR